ncbi:S8 family peptidase [Rothia dentocariosa]|uniref:S8 family peptidase n=1 Tax=Rothia dentocariosa TaxID=2047 RepID=UPI0019589545|nr:S8 family serine peptidase [Rothia dentocariosa]VTY10477.1 Thermophilic serine proteinase [Rothia dentocariosa]
MTRSNHIAMMTRTSIRRVVALLGCGALATGLALSGAPAAAAPTASPTPITLTPAEAAVLGKDDVRQHEYWLTDYRIVDAWKQSTGSGVTVAVIDTGVDGTHPDLVDNVLEGYDASGEGSPNGWQGLGVEPMHGTEVASLIAGHGHNVSGIPKIAGQPGKPAGVIGVAPDAKILPISLNMVSNAEKSIDEQIPAAVRYAVDHGAQVINLSIGSNKTTWPKSWDDAFAYAEEKGVVVVASAGNRGSGITQVGAPATIPGVLTVGGVDRQREASKGSSTQGISIGVTAPSNDMIAAAPGNKYMIWSGSSASAPLVSGLAALIKSKYPNLSAAQIIQRITESADDTGAAGRDPVYGFGIINPLMALDPSTPQDATENPLGSLKAWIAVHRRQEVPAPTPADASATPVHEEGETIVKAKIPEPSRPVEDRGFLPFIIVGALFVILGLLTVRSVRRLHRLHVNVRDVVPHPHLHGHGEPKQASHSKPSAVSVAVPEASAPVAPAIQPPAASAPQSPEPETAVPDAQAQTQVVPASVPSPAPDAAAAVPSAPSSGLQPGADQNLDKQQDAAATQKSAVAAGTEQSAVPTQPPAIVQNVGTTEHNVDSAQNVGAVQPVASASSVAEQSTVATGQPLPQTQKPAESQQPAQHNTVAQTPAAPAKATQPADQGNTPAPEQKPAASEPQESEKHALTQTVAQSEDVSRTPQSPAAEPVKDSTVGQESSVPEASQVSADTIGKASYRPVQKNGMAKHRVHHLGRRPLPPHRKPRLPHISGIKRQVPETGVPDVPAEAASSTSTQKPAAQNGRPASAPRKDASVQKKHSTRTPRKKTANSSRLRLQGAASGRSSIPAAPESGVPEPSSAHEPEPQNPSSS